MSTTARSAGSAAGELAVTQQLILRPDDLVQPMHPAGSGRGFAVRQLIDLHPSQQTVSKSSCMRKTGSPGKIPPDLIP